jgi:Flp pilus assembly protein TadG
VPERDIPGHLKRRPDGNITVELALALPLLLLIIAGTVDLGLLYWTKNVLTHASREGARAAALASVSGAPQNTKSQVMQLVQDYLNKNNLKDTSGNPVSLIMDENFVYSWDTATSPAKLAIELRNISVRMMLLPSAQELVNGTISPAIVQLTAQTTMSPEWTSTPLP